MAPDIRRSRLVAGLAFVSGFGLGVGLLTFMGTALLGLGDPKFGATGWAFYWPLWFAFYSPAAVVVALQPLRVRALPHSYYPTMLALLLVLVAGSFALDLGWAALLGELALLIALSEAWVRRTRAAA